VIRIAAFADAHFDAHSRGRLRPHLDQLGEEADVLLVAGDWTTCGDPDEAAVGGAELGDLPVPVVGVLGNHDYHAGREAEVRARLQAAGIRVVEGEATTVQANGAHVAIAGLKGFGGGFAGACATDFGEPEMKAFVRHTRSLAERLERTLATADADARIALLHYSPVEMTLMGERPEIYPFLGSYLLAEAIDTAGADLAVHGHAHAGTEHGMTSGGVRVRNVAQPVIGQAFHVYNLQGPGPGPLSS
jgi:Icc-related predicted phosphoesterase